MTWLSPLRVEESGQDRSGRSVWQLLDVLAFRSQRFGLVAAPAGFRTNFASVPRLPLVFLLAGDRAHKEAALHDLEYTLRRRTREEADALFLEALLANPAIPTGLAHTMHKAVRWFGQRSWEDETNIVQPSGIRALVAPAHSSRE